MKETHVTEWGPADQQALVDALVWPETPPYYQLITTENLEQLDLRIDEQQDLLASGKGSTYDAGVFTGLLQARRILIGEVSRTTGSPLHETSEDDDTEIDDDIDDEDEDTDDRTTLERVHDAVECCFKDETIQTASRTVEVWVDECPAFEPSLDDITEGTLTTYVYQVLRELRETGRVEKVSPGSYVWVTCTESDHERLRRWNKERLELMRDM